MSMNALFISRGKSQVEAPDLSPTASKTFLLIFDMVFSNTGASPNIFLKSKATDSSLPNLPFASEHIPF